MSGLNDMIRSLVEQVMADIRRQADEIGATEIRYEGLALSGKGSVIATFRARIPQDSVTTTTGEGVIMAWERISKIPETLYGSFVFAQANRGTGERRVVCTGCKQLEGRTFRSDAVAIITAAEHAESVDH